MKRTNQFVKFDPPCGVIDTALFKDLVDHLQYRTVDVIGIEELDVNSIHFKNSNGQVINLARSTGTDKENVKGLKQSLVNQGWDITKIPPIVEKGENVLYDGFSRHEALLELGQQKAPYLVVKRKDNFTVDDVIDEIGLGANNHSQSKKATMSDFKKRFHAFVIRMEEDGKQVTTNDGIKWFACIENPFDKSAIESAVAAVLADERARKTMESLNKTTAQEKGAKLLDLDIKNVLAINKQRSGKDYLKRVAFECIVHYQKYNDVPSVVGFLSGIEAENSEFHRERLEKEVETINRAMSSLADQYKSDPTYNFIKFEGFIPQIIGEETDGLVKS